MSETTVFECAECGLHYCVTCQGGEDACPTCQAGPLCTDCAADHASDHLADTIEECLTSDEDEPSAMLDDQETAEALAARACGHRGCKLRAGHIPGHTDR